MLVCRMSQSEFLDPSTHGGEEIPVIQGLGQLVWKLWCFVFGILWTKPVSRRIKAQKCEERMD